MKSGGQRLHQCTVVEEHEQLTLQELCRACSIDEEIVHVWVFEGVLEPLGQSAPEWRFAGESLQRARRAARLSRELEIHSSGLALVLDLLDEITTLRARLQRSRGR